MRWTLARLALAVIGAVAVTAGAAGPSPVSAPLAVFGNLKTIEIAPVLLAADRLVQPRTKVEQGGIPNLIGEGARGGAPPPPADLGTHAETQLLRLSVRHPELRIILTVAEGHYRIVARKSSSIARVADLKGKRVATNAPTSAGYFLHKMLQQAGLSYSDITVVPTAELADAPRLIAAGKVDAVAVWEPYSDNARKALGPDAIEFDGRGVYRESFNLNTTAADLADPAKRKQIVKFARSVMRASRMISGNPAPAQALVVAASGFTRDEVERAWRHHSFPAALGRGLLDTMVEEERWLAASGKRPPRSRDELEKLIDPSIAAEAAAGL